MTRVRSRSAVMALSVRGWVGGCGALLLAGCSSNCLRDSDCGDGYAQVRVEARAGDVLPALAAALRGYNGGRGDPCSTG